MLIEGGLVPNTWTLHLKFYTHYLRERGVFKCSPRRKIINNDL